MRAVGDHHRVVGDRHRLVHVVGDHDAGQAEGVVEAAHQAHHHAAGDRIQARSAVRRRSSAADRARARGPGRRGAPCRRRVRAETGRPAARRPTACNFIATRRRITASGSFGVRAQRQRDVLGRGQVGEQAVALQQHADALAHLQQRALRARHLLAEAPRPSPRPARSSPVSAASSVDLPLPDGPSTAVDAAARHRQAMSRSTARPPRSRRRSVMRTAGVVGRSRRIGRKNGGARENARSLAIGALNGPAYWRSRPRLSQSCGRCGARAAIAPSRRLRPASGMMPRCQGRARLPPLPLQCTGRARRAAGGGSRAQLPADGDWLRPDIVLVPQFSMRRWLQQALAERLGICANLTLPDPGRIRRLRARRTTSAPRPRPTASHPTPCAGTCCANCSAARRRRSARSSTPRATTRARPGRWRTRSPTPSRSTRPGAATGCSPGNARRTRARPTTGRRRCGARIGRDQRASRASHRRLPARFGPKARRTAGLAAAPVRVRLPERLARRAAGDRQPVARGHAAFLPAYAGARRSGATSNAGPRYTPAHDDAFLGGAATPHPIRCSPRGARPDATSSRAGRRRDRVRRRSSSRRFAEPARDTLLGRMQATCSTTVAPLHDTADAAWPRAATSIARDASLQFHACHTRLREVQVLHDQLRALLEADAPEGGARLQPRDIAVLAPDIDAYAPHIEAVFGGALGSAREIPYTIADTSPLASAPVAEAFLRLLELPLRALIARRRARPARRAGDRRALRPRRRRPRARCRTGSRTPARAGAWMPPIARAMARDGDRAYTFEFALDRLLLGYASGEDDDIAGVAPWPELEGQAAEALDGLLRCVAMLRDARCAPGRTASAGGLGARARNACSTTPSRPRATAPTPAIAASRLREADRRLRRRRGARATTTRRSNTRSCSNTCAANSAQADARAPFLSGGVCFGRMVPMRLIPFRVVCLLGMDEDAFPARDGARSVNRIAQRARHARTPHRRSLAARCRPLSVPAVVRLRRPRAVPELVRHGSARQQPARTVDAGRRIARRRGARTTRGDAARSVREALVVRHALQPFSPAAFGAAHGRASGDASNRAASATTRAGAPPPRKPRASHDAPVFAPPTLWLPRDAERGAAVARSPAPLADAPARGLPAGRPRPAPAGRRSAAGRTRTARRARRAGAIHAARTRCSMRGCARVAGPMRMRCTRGCSRARWSRRARTAARRSPTCWRTSRPFAQMALDKGFGDAAHARAVRARIRRPAPCAARSTACIAPACCAWCCGPTACHGGHAVRHGLDRLCAVVARLRCSSCAREDKEAPPAWVERKPPTPQARRGGAGFVLRAGTTPRCARRWCSCPRAATPSSASSTARTTRPRSTRRRSRARDLDGHAVRRRRPRGSRRPPRASRCAAAIPSSTANATVATRFKLLVRRALRRAREARAARPRGATRERDRLRHAAGRAQPDRGQRGHRQDLCARGPVRARGDRRSACRCRRSSPSPTPSRRRRNCTNACACACSAPRNSRSHGATTTPTSRRRRCRKRRSCAACCTRPCATKPYRPRCACACNAPCATWTSPRSPPSTASASACSPNTRCSPASRCCAPTSNRATPRNAIAWRSCCGAAHARTAEGADFLQRTFRDVDGLADALRDLLPLEPLLPPPPSDDAIAHRDAAWRTLREQFRTHGEADLEALRTASTKRILKAGKEALPVEAIWQWFAAQSDAAPQPHEDARVAHARGPGEVLPADQAGDGAAARHRRRRPGLRLRERRRRPASAARPARRRAPRRPGDQARCARARFRRPRRRRVRRARGSRGRVRA